MLFDRVLKNPGWLDNPGAISFNDHSTVGKVVDAAGAVIAAGADLFWSMISSLAPALVPILREISEKGIFGFLKEKIGDVLDTLTEREREVLEQRFGLKDGYSRTLEEVGRQFQVTRERIRQIEAKALRKMRHPTRIRKLEGFIELPNLP